MLLASSLVLLNSGFKQIPAEESVDKGRLLMLQQHEGSYCYNCASYMCISGTRLKCAHCPNLDCCTVKP